MTYKFIKKRNTRWTLRVGKNDIALGAFVFNSGEKNSLLTRLDGSDQTINMDCVHVELEQILIKALCDESIDIFVKNSRRKLSKLKGFNISLNRQLNAMPEGYSGWNGYSLTIKLEKYMQMS